MAELLVSVRSVEEAEAALQGGAAVIDIKEPSRGALGRADDDVIRAIVAHVDKRCPVSAALGEWSDEAHVLPNAELTYVKWGLAAWAGHDWKSSLRRVLGRTNPQVVLAAYADWQCAQAPSVEEVFALACERPGSVMLVDTCCKDLAHNRRPTLLDWLPSAWVEDLCGRAREAGVRIALAGSLGAGEIESLKRAEPDWFAVRGAVCIDSDRQATVQTAKVRALVELLHAMPAFVG